METSFFTGQTPPRSLTAPKGVCSGKINYIFNCAVIAVHYLLFKRHKSRCLAVDDFKAKRVSIKDLKPDMILARDVVLNNGQVLFTRETPIFNVDLNALYSNDIDSVYIKDFSGGSAALRSGDVNDVVNELDDILRKYDTDKNNEKDNVFDNVMNAVNSNVSHFYGISKPGPPKPIETEEDYLAFRRLYGNAKETTEKYVSVITSGGNIDIDDLYVLPKKVMDSLNCKSDIFSYVSNIKDKDLFAHSSNVALLCNLFGTWLNLNETDLTALTIAGMLHDIGKTQISPNLLSVSGTPSERQRAAMERHPMYGYNLLKPEIFSEDIRLAALCHHEKPDGSGYPNKLNNKAIPDIAKIVSICDKYENAVANRGNPEKRCPFDVLHEFETTGYHDMDPKYLYTFMKNIASAFQGKWVRLSTGVEAVVFFLHQNNLAKPIVKTVSGDAIDLSYQKNIYILSIL